MPLPDPFTYPKPPGQDRQYPKPARTGKIYFKIPGHDLEGETYYELYGKPGTGKVPLICLHGGPGFPHQYMVPISLVSADYERPVIMYDQIGCGESTRFPDHQGDTALWTPELFIAELENLKKALSIDQFDLLGHSWGGMVAGQYAATMQPTGLRKLILCDSLASMATWSKVANELRALLPPDVQAVMDRCEREDKTASEEYKAAMLKYFKCFTIRLDPFPKEFLDAGRAVAGDHTVYDTMNGRSEFEVLGSLKTWDITEDLKNVTAETVPGGILLINGYFDQAQDDCMLPYFQQPSATVKWVQFGLSAHSPHLEETEKFIKVVGEFLEEY